MARAIGTETLSYPRVPIKSYILEYALNTFKALTPGYRSAGFDEVEGQERGEGDLMDLIASLVLFDAFSKKGKICVSNITSGAGDKSDLELEISGQMTRWNVKTSKYKPIHDGLNMFVKLEELTKRFDGYIQCFVHLTDDPHIHIGGACIVDSPAWKRAVREPIQIPRTGHYGIAVPIEELIHITSLTEMIDDKPQ